MESIEHLLGKVHQGDNLTELKKLPDCCVDSVVCDPPYGLQFMGKHWDYDVPKVDIWREVMRVLKPGGHLLSFFGTRTYHRGVIAIEDAGFEIRDQIGWCYGSGFPKSHDISKAIDKQAGEVRPDAITGGHMGAAGRAHGCDTINEGGREIEKNIPAVVGKGELTRGTPVSEAAKLWKGWGTALKPAWEPICVARKPISEDTIAANVIKHGTGAINIDGCRVGTEEDCARKPSTGMGAGSIKYGGEGYAKGGNGSPLGRWPANVIHDGSEEVTAGFPNTGASKAAARGGTNPNPMDWGNKRTDGDIVKGHDDLGGSAARFFYTAKASKWDRNEDLENFELKARPTMGSGIGGQPNQQIANNNHPTVKPTDLMQYLCRLVTPPDGIVLDPYSGSGSTGKAALLECFRFIGYEREAEYCKIANARIAQIKGQLKLF